MPASETPAPDYVTVTCLTCHERIAVTLIEEPQTIRCTFCEAPVKVPSREDAHRKLAARRQNTPEQIGEYAVVAADLPGDKNPKTPRSTKTGAGGQPQPAVPTWTLECPTCHELVKAEIRAKAYRIPCTFCAVLLSVPDAKTVAGWKAKTVAPRSSKEIGEYTAGAVPVSQPLRPGNVFERLAEIRQEVAPAPPHWTFFSGVFTLPWRAGAMSRWIYMSLGFTAMLGIAIVLKGLAAEFSGMASGVAVGFFLLPIIWITYFTLSYAAACGINIFESTAAGLDEIEAWPEPNWREWMTEMIYLGWIGVIPLAVGYGAALLAVPQGVPIYVTLPATFFVLYPIALLSAMEANTIWVPLTLPILKSLVRWWWAWFLFYSLAGLLVAAIVAAAIFLIESLLDGFLLGLGPVIAAAAFIYFRLLGRLAWRMTAKVKKPKKAKSALASGGGHRFE